MKTRIFVLCLLFSFLFSFSVGSIGVSAASSSDGDSAEADDSGYVEWEINGDGSILTGDGKEYYAYTLPDEFYLYPSCIYEYANPVSAGHVSGDLIGQTYVYAPFKDSEFVWMEGSEYLYFYATRRAEYDLDRFFADQTDGTLYLLDSEANFAPFTRAALQSLENDRFTASEYTEFYLNDLKNCPYYTVLEFEETDTLAAKRAYLFEVDEAFYYVPYSTIPYEYFDEYGDLVFTHGVVSAIALSSASESMLFDALDDFTYRMTSYEYEDNLDWGYPYEDSSMPIGLFWFCYVFLGFLVPIPFIVLGFILPHIAKLGRPKYWYVTAYLGIAWFVLAFVLMFLLI
ncbi:MAG: hypothetical protein J6B77_08145 [Clostridia bacterium]|nr:hypothetical protein [Clostridia bacterium]